MDMGKRRPKKNQGITGIGVNGFKSLCNGGISRIIVKPLTVLAGANSSGKSSIMQPLLLIKQTMEAQYDPGALLLDGPNVKFTSSKQLLSVKQEKKCSDHFEVEIEADGINRILLSFKASKKQGFDILEMQLNGVPLRGDMSQDDILVAVPSISRGIVEQTKKRKGILRIVRVKSFLSPAVTTLEGNVIFWLPLSDRHEELIRNIIHVPGVRGNPERTYPTTSFGPKYPGRFDLYVASVILNWKKSAPEKLKQLNSQMIALGLTWKVEASPLDDTQVEIKVGRSPQSKQGGAKDLVSIADVGFGVSQALPALVSMLAATPQQLVYIEQPELHLHPKAQVKLAEVICDAVDRGVKVVIETHSSLLLLGIQTMVAQGKMHPENVSLNWFQRDQGGVTKITSSDLDENGAFNKEWPEDFDDVSEQADKDFLDAVGKKFFGK